MMAREIVESAVAEPFLAEIRIVSFQFPPKGWALCNGQILPINQNQALFSLLGTTYGGDGRVNFALPNLQSRTPVHVGDGLTLGQTGGAEAITLTQVELPTHTHGLVATADVTSSADPAGRVPAKKARFGSDIYAVPANPTTLAPGSVSPAGGSQAHLNMQPFLTLNFVIALQGIFPSQN
jgi:microcystin-dependent protein